MFETLFWLYLINATLLINHEIESAYWKEWDLFNLKMGITGFLVIHFPALFIILYGVIMIFNHSKCGLAISLLLSICGIGASIIHTYFIKKGHKEFTLTISKFILISTFMVSLIQFGLTIYAFWQ